MPSTVSFLGLGLLGLDLGAAAAAGAAGAALFSGDLDLEDLPAVGLTGDS